MVDFRFRAWSAGDTTQDVAAAAAGDGRRRRRCCPRQRALGWPRSGQSGRAAVAGREAGGAAEGREAAMQPKPEGQAAQQPEAATAASGGSGQRSWPACGSVTLTGCCCCSSSKNQRP